MRRDEVSSVRLPRPSNSVTQRTQTYTYDAFGNILSIGGNSARNTPTSSSTNRLTRAATMPAAT